MKITKRKLLADSTVIKAFKQLGFVEMDSQYGQCVMEYYSASNRIVAELDTQQHSKIKLSDARMFDYSNVHIVSYWAWPSNLKDLNYIIEKIKHVYGNVCNIHFAT